MEIWSFQGSTSRGTVGIDCRRRVATYLLGVTFSHAQACGHSKSDRVTFIQDDRSAAENVNLVLRGFLIALCDAVTGLSAGRSPNAQVKGVS